MEEEMLALAAKQWIVTSAILFISFPFLAIAIELWEKKIPNCLSCFMYYVTKYFLFLDTLLLVLVFLCGGTFFLEENIKSLKILIGIDALLSLCAFSANERLNGDNLWKLTIKHNLEAEELQFLGTSKEASFRLYEEIEKIRLLYKKDYGIELCGTTVPRLMEIIKDEDKIIGFKGVLEGANECFQFIIEKAD